MIAFINNAEFMFPARMNVSQNQSSRLTPDLLSRVAQGDAEAFSVLYDQSSSLLFTLAVRILNNREEAAELLQDVYVEAWRKAGAFDHRRGSPMAWLITLTRSRAIDRLRAAAVRGSRATASIDDTPLSQLPSYTLDPLATRSAEELRSQVVTALTDLPAAQQEALELAFYEGLTHAEIATKLKQPLGTVKTRIKLGMNKLRYALRPSVEAK